MAMASLYALNDIKFSGHKYKWPSGGLGLHLGLAFFCAHGIVKSVAQFFWYLIENHGISLCIVL